MGLNIIKTDSVSALVTKQDKLIGQPGQVVGFDADGAAVAMDMPAQAQGGNGTNILDDWYFPDPINQRGVSGTITALGYFIDRWKLVSGSVTISEGGLLLNGTIAQILETDPGQEVTASYLTDSGVLPAEYDSETRTFAITAAGDLLRAAKLELGDHQTLAHQDEDGNWVLNDPPPNKALELAKCQRYYQQSWTGPRITAAKKPDNRILRVAVMSTLLADVDFPVEMRASPTVSFFTVFGEEGAALKFADDSKVSGITAGCLSGKGFCGYNSGAKFTTGALYSFHWTASADL